MNHWCRGALAVFTIRETMAAVINKTVGPPPVLKDVEEVISKADAMDWMIRYFIIISLFFFVSAIDFIKNTEQENVFIVELSVKSAETNIKHKVVQKRLYANKFLKERKVFDCFIKDNISSSNIS